MILFSLILSILLSSVLLEEQQGLSTPIVGTADPFVLVTATEVRCPLYDFLAGDLVIKTTQSNSGIYIAANGTGGSEKVSIAASGVNLAEFRKTTGLTMLGTNPVVSAEVRTPLVDYLAGDMTVSTTLNTSTLTISSGGRSLVVKAHGKVVGRWTDNQFVGPLFETNFMQPITGSGVNDLTLNYGNGKTVFIGDIAFGGAKVTGGFHQDSTFVIFSDTFGEVLFTAPFIGFTTIDASASTGLLRLIIPDIAHTTSVADTFVFANFAATLSQKTLVAPTTDSLSPSIGNTVIDMGPLKMQGDIDMNGFCIYNTLCLNLSSPVDVEGVHKTKWDGIWTPSQVGNIGYHRMDHTVHLFVPQVMGGGGISGIPSIDIKLPDDLKPATSTRSVITVTNGGGDMFGTAVVDTDGSLKIGNGAGLYPFESSGPFMVGWYKFTMTYDVPL